MAYPYQQMQDQQAAKKAEPDLPSDAMVQNPVQAIPVHDQVQPVAAAYPVMGQPYQGQPMPTMGQPYQPQPMQPTMGQPYQPQAGSATMAYPMQPGMVPYAQPYAQPYPQQAQMYAQPVMPQMQVQSNIQCVICTQYVLGYYFRCIGCKNNGRPGGYYLCPTCHSRQKVKEKSLFDEVNQELNAWTSNTTCDRPHEKWHPYERVDPVVQAPPPVYMVPSAVPGGQPQFVAVQALPMAPVSQTIKLTLGARDVAKTGFGFVFPDTSLAVSINGQEVIHTEQEMKCCNPNYKRTVDVSNAETKVTFTLYTGGTRSGTTSCQMSDILKAPNQTWVHTLEDPKTGYRLASGSVVVKWAAVQAAPAMAVAQPVIGGQAAGVPYAAPPPSYQ